MLQEKAFLLRDEPHFIDFDLWGMLANFLYTGHYQLPAAHSRLKDWHARLSTRKKSASLPVKNYILDTNVLLHDPNSLLAFKGNTVLIPIEVIEEIDRFKRESSELGQNARTVSRMLDGLRQKGRLNSGVKLDNGGNLRILFHDHTGDKLPFGNNTVDSRIVGLALAVHKSDLKTPTILVTKDINLRIKADTLGLPAEDYETDRILLTDLYSRNDRTHRERRENVALSQ